MVSLINKISNSTLDSSGNLKINFRLSTVDLSANFNNIKVSLNENNILYDHTIPSSINFNTDEFKTSSLINFSARSVNKTKKEHLAANELGISYF